MPSRGLRPYGRSVSSELQYTPITNFIPNTSPSVQYALDYAMTTTTAHSIGQSLQACANLCTAVMFDRRLAKPARLANETESVFSQLDYVF